jgi:hypothetical protein
MRVAWVSVLFSLLVACGGSSQPAPSTATAPVVAEPPPRDEPATTPPAPPASGSIEDDAIAFIAAIAARDRAAIAPMLFDRTACERLAESGEKVPGGAIDACAEEMAKNNELGLSVYEAGISADFEPGKAEATTLDGEKSSATEVAMVLVYPRDGTPGEPVSVFIVTLQGHRYVVFPMKSEKKSSGSKKP